MLLVDFLIILTFIGTSLVLDSFTHAWFYSIMSWSFGKHEFTELMQIFQMLTYHFWYVNFYYIKNILRKNSLPFFLPTLSALWWKIKWLQVKFGAHVFVFRCQQFDHQCQYQQGEKDNTWCYYENSSDFTCSLNVFG